MMAAYWWRHQESRNTKNPKLQLRESAHHQRPCSGGLGSPAGGGRFRQVISKQATSLLLPPVAAHIGCRQQNARQRVSMQGCKQVHVCLAL